jgi:hypothetical protein
MTVDAAEEHAAELEAVHRGRCGSRGTSSALPISARERHRRRLRRGEDSAFRVGWLFVLGALGQGTGVRGRRGVEGVTEVVGGRAAAPERDLLESDVVSVKSDEVTTKPSPFGGSSGVSAPSAPRATRAAARP